MQQTILDIAALSERMTDTLSAQSPAAGDRRECTLIFQKLCNLEQRNARPAVNL
jgi:hypothetical protein